MLRMGRRTRLGNAGQRLRLGERQRAYHAAGGPAREIPVAAVWRSSLIAIRPPGSVSRHVLLAAVAALGLHSLRASAGWGGHAHGELDAAHAYVPAVTWTVLLAAALVTAHFVFRLTTPAGSAPSSQGAPRGLLRSWWLVSLTLIFVCVGQEALEHVWVTGSVPAVDQALTAGGWTVVPLAALAGAVVTVASRGSDAVLTLASSSGQTRVRQVLSCGLGRRLATEHPRRRDPLVALPAGRAPPLAVVSL